MIVRRLGTPTILLCLLLSVSSARTQNQSNAADAGTAGVKQLISDYSDGLNHHDAHAVAMLFDEDADFTNMRGMSHHGRKEMENFFGVLFAGPLKNVRRTDTVKTIRLLTPEIASVDGFWEMTGTKGADGSDNPVRKGLFDYVVTKQNGQWFITVFHESDFTMPQANPASK